MAVAIAVLAAAAMAIWTAVTGSPASAAAPYPPSEPCTLSAAYRAPAGPAARYDVTGSGLGPTQPVRVALAGDNRTLGYARTDEYGRFTTAVTVPATADRSAPALSAATASRRCLWTPPPANLPQPGGQPPVGPVPGGNGSTGVATPAPGGGTAAPGGGTGGGDGASGPTTSGAGAGGNSATPSASSGTDAPSTPSGAPPRAEPSTGTQPPFGIGLAIAAALLVLGTLAVLVLTRRPEH